jgi:hypothetical protein
MGISRYVRLVLPKVVALTLAMPLVTLWGSSMALFGAWCRPTQLGLSFDFSECAAPGGAGGEPADRAVEGRGLRLLIALVACHFGLRVRPNTESLSANTTASVVSSITVVILVDAVFAIATRSIGLPRGRRDGLPCRTLRRVDPFRADLGASAHRPGRCGGRGGGAGGRLRTGKTTCCGRWWAFCSRPRARCGCSASPVWR